MNFEWMLHNYREQNNVGSDRPTRLFWIARHDVFNFPQECTVEPQSKNFSHTTKTTCVPVYGTHDFSCWDSLLCYHRHCAFTIRTISSVQMGYRTPDFHFFSQHGSKSHPILPENVSEMLKYLLFTKNCLWRRLLIPIKAMYTIPAWLQ